MIELFRFLLKIAYNYVNKKQEETMTDENKNVEQKETKKI